jgi:hypothetical protein
MGLDKNQVSRIGMGAKGLVYCLIGGLTFWGTFRYSPEKTGTKGSLEFLKDQPLGEIILWLLVLGLGFYVFWRMYQSIWDPEKFGTSLKGIGTRIGCFSSGVFYAALMYTALQILIGFGGSGSEEGSQELYIQILLNQEFGRWLVVGVAIGFLANAGFQFYLAVTGSYKLTFDEDELSQSKRNLLVATGILGYGSRSIVIGLISYLTLQAALTYNSKEAGGTGDAFLFVQNQFGDVVLGIIACGLFAYGVFMLLKGKERKMDF